MHGMRVRLTFRGHKLAITKEPDAVLEKGRQVVNQFFGLPWSTQNKQGGDEFFYGDKHLSVKTATN